MEAVNLKIITDELSKFSGMVKEEEIQGLADEIKKANKIFLAGAGRSGLAARGFTNRLLHMGFDVHFVGEISCPPIKEGDLIILGSGSGTTQSLIVMGEKAKKVGARIATVTMFPTHTIGEMADVIVTVPGSTPKKAEGEKYIRQDISIEPGQFRRLMAYCQREDRSISWVIRKALEMFLMCNDM